MCFYEIALESEFMAQEVKFKDIELQLVFPILQFLEHLTKLCAKAHKTQRDFSGICDISQYQMQVSYAGTLIQHFENMYP